MSIFLCCDASRFGGCGVGQSCVCSVPGLIWVVWCGGLCFEGFCGLGGFVESILWCVFGCNEPCVGTHSVFVVWVVLLCLCLYVPSSVHWGIVWLVCCDECSVCGFLQVEHAWVVFQ